MRLYINSSSDPASRMHTSRPICRVFHALKLNSCLKPTQLLLNIILANTDQSFQITFVLLQVASANLWHFPWPRLGSLNMSRSGSRNNIKDVELANDSNAERPAQSSLVSVSKKGKQRADKGSDSDSTDSGPPSDWLVQIPEFPMLDPKAADDSAKVVSDEIMKRVQSTIDKFRLKTSLKSLDRVSWGELRYPSSRVLMSMTTI